ncbi:MAG: ABC transporter permease [Firmicutes bacterium]|nr:ABC transporter permease [Bacillota bacterium]
MNPDVWPKLAQATLETLDMVGASVLFAALLGLPLGVLVVITRPGHVMPLPALQRALGVLINTARSVPFLILMVALFPLTRLIVGTAIGTRAAVVPMTVGATPFVARLVEQALLEVDAGVITAALSMGATPWQMVRKVLLPEALPGLVLGITIATVSLLEFSAVAGAIGGGGLGDLGYRAGYQRYRADILLGAVVLLVAMVQAVQFLGETIAQHIRARRSIA